MSFFCIEVFSSQKRFFQHDVFPSFYTSVVRYIFLVMVFNHLKIKKLNALWMMTNANSCSMKVCAVLTENLRSIPMFSCWRWVTGLWERRQRHCFRLCCAVWQREICPFSFSLVTVLCVFVIAFHHRPSSISCHCLEPTDTSRCKDKWRCDNLAAKDWCDLIRVIAEDSLTSTTLLI